MQDSVSGQTGMIEILSGENNLDLDVGVVAVGTIAGTVWQDSQYDGIYNRKESGLSGATIELVNPADGQTVHMTQTDENGRYALDFVRMGEYALRVTLPDGMMFTCGGESVVAQTDASRAESDSFAVADGREPRNEHRRDFCRKPCVTRDDGQRCGDADTGRNGGRDGADGCGRLF